MNSSYKQIIIMIFIIGLLISNVALAENNYKVGTSYYDTFSEAVNSISSSGTIELVVNNFADSSDVTISSGKSIVLNMNGYTLRRLGATVNNGTFEITGNGAFFTATGANNTLDKLIQNTGRLVVNNVAVRNLGRTNGEWNTVYSNGGTVILNSGSISATPSDGLSSTGAGRAIAMLASCNVEVNGGTVAAPNICIVKAANSTGNISITSPGKIISQSDGIVIRSGSSGTLTMNSGAIEALNGTAINQNGSTTINIKNGTITGKRAIGIYEGSGNTTVSGGTITGQGDECQGILDRGSGILTILNGTIISEKASAINKSINGSLIIGNDDSTINSTPRITGEAYGIYTANDVQVELYDGTIEGRTKSHQGAIDVIASGYQLDIEQPKTTETDNNYEKCVLRKIDEVLPGVYVDYYEQNDGSLVVSVWAYRHIKTQEAGWNLSEYDEGEEYINGFNQRYIRYILSKRFSSNERVAGTRRLVVEDNAGYKVVAEYTLDVTFDVDFNNQKLFLAAFFGSQYKMFRNRYLGTRRIGTDIVENGLYVSNDGITWKFLGYMPFDKRDMAFYYRNGVFYAIGTADVIDRGTVRILVFKSKDLLTWTSAENGTYEFDCSLYTDILMGTETPKKIPGFTNLYRPQYSWVTESIETWGPKWHFDGDNIYISFCVTDTTVDYRKYNYWNQFYLPIESFGTDAEEKDLECKNIVFGSPSMIDLNDENGTDVNLPFYGTNSNSPYYYKNYPENLLRLSNAQYPYSYRSFGRIGGVVTYKVGNKWYLISKQEQTAYWNQQLEVYESTTGIFGQYRKVENNLKYSRTNNLKDNNGNYEIANKCIDPIINQTETHFEGHYILPLKDRKIIVSDHIVTDSNTSTDHSFLFNDSHIGGMSYANINITEDDLSISNWKLVSIMNTELWKEQYKRKNEEEYFLSDFAVRNSPIYEVKDQGAVNIIRNFANANNISIKYYDGEKEIIKAVNGTINITGINPAWDGGVNTKTFNINLFSSHPLTQAKVNGTVVPIADDEVTVLYQITTAGTYEFALTDTFGSTKNVTVVVDKVLCVKKIPDKTYTGSAITIDEEKVACTINGATSTKYTPTNYQNNIEAGLATCDVVVSGVTIKTSFKIKPLAPENAKIWINNDNSVKLTWDSSESNVMDYHIDVYEKANPTGQNYLMKVKDVSQTEVSLLKNFVDGTSYQVAINARVLPTLKATDVTSSTTIKTTVDPANYAFRMVPIPFVVCGTGNDVILEVDTDITHYPAGRTVKFGYFYELDGTRHVIQDFSEQTSATFKVPTPGDYKFFVQMLDVTDNLAIAYENSSDTIKVVGDPIYIKGDIDHNGEINIIDVRLLLQIYINNEVDNDEMYIRDMDENGTIDIIDVRLLLQLYINS